MKLFKILYFSIFSLNSIYLSAQEFEGIVESKVSYTVKNDNFSVSELENLFGTEYTTYYKTGYYKAISESQFMSYQLYNNSEGRIYYMHNLNDDTLRYQSTIAKNESVYEFEIFENADTVLGKVCKMLVANNQTRVNIYSFSEDYYINPESYKNFTVSNLFIQKLTTKSLNLRTRSIYEDFEAETIVTKITEKKLDKSIFQLPNHKFLKKE